MIEDWLDELFVREKGEGFDCWTLIDDVVVRKFDGQLMVGSTVVRSVEDIELVCLEAGVWG